MDLLAIGTNCLALVWVSGRSRVPCPPLRISAFILPPKFFFRRDNRMTDLSCQNGIAKNNSIFPFIAQVFFALNIHKSSPLEPKHGLHKVT